ncbi:MAG: hypothetical protein RR816_12295, partial [Clostridia bacterium]
MQSIGRGLLLLNKLRTPDEVLAKIDAVTPENVMDMASRTLGISPSAAIVGKNAEKYLQSMHL